jgi:putative MATE family efflux protein
MPQDAKPPAPSVTVPEAARAGESAAEALVPAAKFLTGSTMRHIVVMTASTSAGLFALFAVDFINIYFLSQLGEVEVAAAIGYAGTLLFFAISFGIGLAIAASAILAPVLGQGDREKARRLTRNVLIFAATSAAVLSAIVWPLLGTLLTGLGAEGRTYELALAYLQIIIPTTPLLVMGMVFAAVLRAVGDAKRSMWVTLGAAALNAILDPIFIFALGLGVEGAAMATSLSRLALIGIGFYGVARVHGLLGESRHGAFWADASAISKIAIPAVLTNLATPFANSYVTGAMAPFGDSAVAGWAIIGRILPLAFVGVFAMTSSVGPVMGQNLGAKNFTRVRDTFTNALIFTVIYTACAWLALTLFRAEIIRLMQASGDAAALISFFILWLSPLFAFFGALFVTNATFNNLGRPQFAAYLNWSRATIGTIPLVTLGGVLLGAKGVLLGNIASAIAFAVIGVLLAYRHIDRLETGEAIRKSNGERGVFSRIPLWPFSTPRS